MTEDEAKTKWCPLAREPDHNTFARSNRGTRAPYTNQPGSLCLGSTCMFWLWDYTAPERVYGEKPEGDGWVEQKAWHGSKFTTYWERPSRPTHGTCAKAQRLPVEVSVPS